MKRTDAIQDGRGHRWPEALSPGDSRAQQLGEFRTGFAAGQVCYLRNPRSLNLNHVAFSCHFPSDFKMIQSFEPLGISIMSTSTLAGHIRVIDFLVYLSKQPPWKFAEETTPGMQQSWGATHSLAWSAACRSFCSRSIISDARTQRCQEREMSHG